MCMWVPWIFKYPGTPELRTLIWWIMEATIFWATAAWFLCDFIPLLSLWFMQSWVGRTWGSHTLSALSGLGYRARTGCGWAQGALRCPSLSSYTPTHFIPLAPAWIAENTVALGEKKRWLLRATSCLWEFEGIDGRGIQPHVKRLKFGPGCPFLELFVSG